MGNLKQFRDTPFYVSDDGEVWSSLNKTFLKKSLTRQGYYRVHPHIDGKHCNFFVARMVAEVWIPNPENKPFVLHNDNDPLNNHFSNLRWGTQSENIKQAYDDKRISAKGENNGQSKLTSAQVIAIRDARKAGFQNRRIAKYFKMSESYIRQVAIGKAWSHIC